ncbi:MAG: DUF4242 domain-containing protein [Methylococcales bacterium]|jgi:hypothetical protein|nr:DUF4242 domain-containing protein [Methylococcales bacterium]
MTTYAVKRELPGITLEQLAEAQKNVIATSKTMTADGTPINYIRSNFFPEDSSCTCLFEAGSARAVEQINETVGVPYTEICEVLDLVP